MYEAIFIPEGFEPPPKDIIKEPDLQVYVDEFGSKTGDICFVAEQMLHYALQACKDIIQTCRQIKNITE